MRSQIGALLATAAALPDLSGATCPPAPSYLIEAEVVSCSSAEPLIRDEVDELFERKREYRARRAKSRGEVPKPFEQAEIEAEVQDRLRTNDAVVEFVVRQTRRVSGWPKLKPEAGWEAKKDSKPVRYLGRIGKGGCDQLGKGRKLVFFEPFQCCDNLPGSNDCMLSLPMALDVPADLLEHSRSGG